MLPHNIAQILEDADPLAVLLDPFCTHVAVEGAQLGGKLVHLQGVEEVAQKGELVGQLQLLLFLLQPLLRAQPHSQQHNVVPEQKGLLFDQLLVV